MSIRSGPESLPSFRVIFLQATFRNFTLLFSWGFWACSSARAFC
jgi:hypothetical protein